MIQPPFPHLDPERYERQREAALRWWANGKNGTVMGATGFGKSVVALLIAKGLLDKYGIPQSDDLLLLVVVPTVVLQEKWTQDFKDWGLEDVAKAVVVNTVVTTGWLFDQGKIMLKVLDEIHLYTGQVFCQALGIDSEMSLGLTATLPSDDEKKVFLNATIPVVDEITLKECMDNGWVSPLDVINVPCPFNEEEDQIYIELDKTFSKAMGCWEGDFDALYSWSRNMNKVHAQASKIGMQSGSLIGITKQGVIAHRARTSMLYSSRSKIEAAAELLAGLPVISTLIFSQTKAVSEEVARIINERTGQETRHYHSTARGHGLSSPKYKTWVLERFREQEFPYLSAAKALDQGVDIPEVSRAIIVSGNGTIIQGSQRAGRILRAVEGKTAVLYDFYIPNTQDRRWQRTRQANYPKANIHEATSVEDAIRITQELTA